MASEQLRLVDGTIVRKCPTVKPLYCSRAGKFYSLHNAILTDDGWVLREVSQTSPLRCAPREGIVLTVSAVASILSCGSMTNSFVTNWLHSRGLDRDLSPSLQTGRLSRWRLTTSTATSRTGLLITFSMSHLRKTASARDCCGCSGASDVIQGR